MLIKHDIHPPPTLRTEHIKTLKHQLINLPLNRCIQIARTNILGVISLILRIKIIKIMRRLELNHRQHLTIQERYRKLAPFNKLLNQHLRIIGLSRTHRVNQFLRIINLAHANA